MKKDYKSRKKVVYKKIYEHQIAAVNFSKIYFLKKMQRRYISQTTASYIAIELRSFFSHKWISLQSL